MFYGTYIIMGVCDATQAHIHSLFDDPLPGNHLRLQDVTWPSHNVFIKKKTTWYSCEAFESPAAAGVAGSATACSSDIWCFAHSGEVKHVSFSVVAPVPTIKKEKWSQL